MSTCYSWQLDLYLAIAPFIKGICRAFILNDNGEGAVAESFVGCIGEVNVEVVLFTEYSISLLYLISFSVSVFGVPHSLK